MRKLLRKIFKELQGFAAWLWNGFDPPERKTWCAAFYFVAQEDATLAYPETTLDPKMAEAVAAVTLAASEVKDTVHVVYRTIPADPIKADPVAKVVRFLGPETGTKFFPDCYETSSLSLVDTGQDLTCFLKWVYRWCPADHYAVFIWGHSFGPAGLFEPGSGVSIPKPGLTALREAFEQFGLTRRAGDRQPAPPPTHVSRTAASNGPSGVAGSTGDSTASQVIQGMANQGDKVEIVLFQDCWMSTIETAFEIAGSTAHMVASQSLIPVGTLYANFVWPYGDLLKALASATFAVDMTKRLLKFYVDNFSYIQYLPTVPLALLDLSKVPALKQPVKALVAKLAALAPGQRLPLLEPARLVKLDTTTIPAILLAGDGGLLDILKLCAWLKSPQAPWSDQQTAADLETELKKLVTISAEAHPASTPDLGFNGVSAFHWPPVSVSTDDFITEAVRRSLGAYKSLEFVKQTGWDQLSLEHKP